MNLCLIPKIQSKAYYPYLGDFTHTYNGHSYYFDFVNESDIPQDIQIASSIFDSVIQAELSMDSMRIAQSGYIISSASNFAADISSLLLNFALSSADAIYQGLLDSSKSMLKWSVTYNGSTGTNRYSWTFSCPLGSQDIILGSDGLLPHPTDHTYTSHDDQAIPDIVDTQISDDTVYIPQQIISINNIRSPYFVGSTLHIPLYINSDNNLHEYVITNAYETQILSEYVSGAQYYRMAFGNDHYQSSTVTFDGVVPGNLGYSSTYNVVYNNVQHQFRAWTTGQYITNANMPSFNTTVNNIPSFNSNILMAPTQGIQNGRYVVATTNAIWLARSTVSPVSNPDDIIIPTDQPLPIEPIVTWPDDNLPDEDPDGDPVVVDPYQPEPINPVVPLPPIPTIVSGNDDLWPDLNDVFDREDDALGFVSLALDWEWPDFSEFLGDYVTSFQWVAAIITALYSGSDLSILFSVLSFFFIAAGMLGIYKWWNK